MVRHESGRDVFRNTRYAPILKRRGACSEKKFLPCDLPAWSGFRSTRDWGSSALHTLVLPFASISVRNRCRLENMDHVACGRRRRRGRDGLHRLA